MPRGAKPKINNQQLKLLRRMLKKKKTKTELAKEFGVCRYTLYKYIKKLGENLSD